MRIILVIGALILFVVGVALFNPNLNPTFFLDRSNSGFVPPNNQPLKTNSWFSSLYTFPSQPIFAFPGIYKVSTAGIEIGLPQVNATANTVAGGFSSQCLIRFDRTPTSSQVLYYGDWNVAFQISADEQLASFNLVQGSPAVYFTSPSTSVELSCKDAPNIPVNQGNSFLIGDYQVILQRQLDNTAQQSGLYRLLILPKTTEELLVNSPWNQIVDTKVKWQVTEDTVTTNYHFQTTQNEPVLTTLWPHHIPYLTENIEKKGIYNTALGNLTLVATNGFATQLSKPSLPDTFSPITDVGRQADLFESLNQDVQQYLTTKPPEGVYFKGTWLGALASLVQLLELYRHPAYVSAQSHLEQQLAESNRQSSYHAQKQLFNANTPEFGHEEGNDHHFHYGYFIRAASIASANNPNFKIFITPLVEEMVEDIATSDRNSRVYPYLRNFSIYEGHSWADGDASFADGNNQESTSEALNAWYSLTLWGRVTQNKDLETLGIWLFSQELSATKAYWFGYENPFPNGYQHQMASIVWGGKRDWGTWFSGQAMHIHGIQWLPITPASSYLKDLPNMPNFFSEIKAEHSNPYTHEWGDLYAGVEAITTTTSPNLSQVSSYSGLKLRSLLYQTIFQD